MPGIAKFALLIVALASAPAATAQQRAIPVPAAARWQHARSGVILPRQIDGLQRSRIIENVAAEIDVTVHYEDADTRVSVFLYRPALPDVAIWFDRAEATLMQNAMFGTVTPASEITPFAPTGSDTPSGLRRAYSGTGEYRATAIAIVPTGRWLLKIRASLRQGDPAAVAARLNAALFAVAFDAAQTSGTVATPMLACPTNVRWRNARQIRPSGSDSLMAALLSLGSSLPPTSEEDAVVGRAAPLPAYCRDAHDDARFSVYRRTGVDDAYVMALGDAGAIIIIGDGLSFSTRGNTTNVDLVTSVSFRTGNQTLGYPSFNRLPAPAQVMAMIEGSRPATSASIDPDIESEATDDERPAATTPPPAG